MDPGTQVLAPDSGDGWDWRGQARCRGLPTNIFFAGELHQGGRRIAVEDDVKRICLGCPVRAQCLHFAMKSEERHGIWGATTPGERRRMLICR